MSVFNMKPQFINYYPLNNWKITFSDWFDRGMLIFGSVYSYFKNCYFGITEASVKKKKIIIHRVIIPNDPIYSK